MKRVSVFSDYRSIKDRAFVREHREWWPSFVAIEESHKTPRVVELPESNSAPEALAWRKTVGTNVDTLSHVPPSLRSLSLYTFAFEVNPRAIAFCDPDTQFHLVKPQHFLDCPEMLGWLHEPETFVDAYGLGVLLARPEAFRSLPSHIVVPWDRWKAVISTDPSLLAFVSRVTSGQLLDLLNEVFGGDEALLIKNFPVWCCVDSNEHDELVYTAVPGKCGQRAVVLYTNVPLPNLLLRLFEAIEAFRIKFIEWRSWHAVLHTNTMEVKKVVSTSTLLQRQGRRPLRNRGWSNLETKSPDALGGLLKRFASFELALKEESNPFARVNRDLVSKAVVPIDKQ